MTPARRDELFWMAENYDSRAREADASVDAFKRLELYAQASRAKTLADGLWQAKAICLKAIAEADAADDRAARRADIPHAR